MNRLEKWTLPKYSLGLPLRGFCDCFSCVENPKRASSGGRRTISLMSTRDRLLAVGVLELEGP